ncbi:MAG: hydroxyacid dehydrogenase [Patescibacteria group bacterium]|nr:hydroxyacid dehydrogenase [Patescibacteria group bacterium]
MKIAFYGVRPEEESYLKERFSSAMAATGASAAYSAERDLLKAADPDADAVCVFIDSLVDKAAMDAFPKLKLVVTRSTGYDHIDVGEAAARGIVVSSVPSYGENTVAEFAFGLILALSRKIYAAADQVKETGSFAMDGLRGFDLLGKTIGVVGTGRIGRHAIRMAGGFGMKVVAYDPSPDEKAAAGSGFRYAGMDELLAASDVVTLHVPLTKETEHMMNAAALAKMKPSALLINTSRGGIVDTGALVQALAAKTIAGAGLDVLEEEGAIKDEAAFLASGHPKEEELKAVLADHALMKMPNVIVTPHVAFNTDEALRRILSTTVDDIKAWAEGAPINTVRAS